MSSWWRDHLDPHLAASTGRSAGADRTNTPSHAGCRSNQRHRTCWPSFPTQPAFDSPAAARTTRSGRAFTCP
ncbi:hypothetical protein [Micromonospora sp. NPDC023888]|uniref:hypothetical protein n=1 Tax=Micromonospora sp. NPDC023888 TaxID=3155607 RepID=UPI0033F00245